MKRTIILAVLIAASFSASADNKFADCILDKMADVQNDQAAYAVMKICIERHPSRFENIEKRTGFLARYSSGAECTASKGKSAGGEVAPQRIRAVCYRLYEPEPKLE